ncbi:MAG: TIGR04282 family arsenosugar biosynthesis glycosyltransferase [Acetobacterales bacterium]
MPSPVRHLVIFTRVPRLGRVKSRLAAGAGAAAALGFHRDTSRAVILRLARDPRWRCWLAVTPGVGETLPWRTGCSSFAQGAGDLGRRMARAMRRLPPGPVVLVGSDIPAIRPAHIARAFRVLAGRDAVFGPAPDGGYWLVGLTRRPRFIDPFAGVRWSTPCALADTLANLEGRRWALVDRLEDVDNTVAWREQRAHAGRVVRPPGP